MNNTKIVYKTHSLCPECLNKIDAALISQRKSTYIEKACPEHGIFKTIVWKGDIPIESWTRKKGKVQIKAPLSEAQRGCPFDCGLCSEHRQHTCTALIEVTQNCNLNCSFCFASSNAGKAENPSIADIKHMYESVKNTSGICNIQLSGGEPTLRDDLPMLVKVGKNLGFNFIQLNTNGLRIAQDEEFVSALKKADLDSIFLQFDGTEDYIYKKIRGTELLAIKIKAIENCEKYSIGVVLVPVLVPGINVDNIGEIIDFALKRIPTVRGVHFQPVSYFGRIPYTPHDDERITLPEVMLEIEKQTNGRITAESLKPPGCENSLCSFHGSYIYLKNGELMKITGNSSCCGKNEKADTALKKAKIRIKGSEPAACDSQQSCCCNTENPDEGSIKAKNYVSEKWALWENSDNKNRSQSSKDSGWDEILDSIHNNSFSLSAMAFQDVWNVDLERVKDCCIHVVNPQGKLIPFCLYNITDANGHTLYRT